ncbi:LRR receptor-like serine/threonine-protein kinase RPK2 [Gastrolobium bilobum]|uniref:LRR receptor-like serine/threonine-protein kinase RPK2 n=1 Tax=Gastrolobium bilobum TaxID=150636 RepID=UPI002AB2C915|nr:LRR receptor-like serine/threonine-protein kinase RPK2 [Gastrolobium bilobum]
MGLGLLPLLLFHLLVFFFTTHHANALNASFASDALSLLSFKRLVSSDPSNLLAGWTNRSSSSLCRWHGVACGGGSLSGGVTALNLTGLQGGELAPSVGDLSELRVLSIPGNMFSGEIPASLGRLRVLEVLELQGNNFSGRVPSQMSYLQSLNLVNLSGNALSGSIPREFIGSGNVKIVDLSNNQFSGKIVVDGLGGCDSLNHLKLSHNFLTGEVPPQIGKCRNLRTLLVDGNILEGRIPPEIGYAVELRVLDVSRNSLTGRIPKELANCLKLSVLVLTDLFDDRGVDEGSLEDSFRGEFNAFVGNIPHEVLLLSSLQVLWAPRANLGGRLPSGWTDSCSLRVLNLAQNYVTGVMPESLGRCRNLTFLDLSSNNLVGYLPSQQLQVPCMMYFNVSRNNISGILPRFRNESCPASSISAPPDPAFLELEGINDAYFNFPVWRFQQNALVGSGFEETNVVRHDFSWNSFVGSLPLFSLEGNLFTADRKVSYMLFLNNNMFNGTLPYQLVSNCNDLKTLSVNLSVNQLSSGNSQALFLDCLQLTDFEAAYNQIGGSIGPGIGDYTMLRRLDLSGNKLSGSLPDQLGNLKNIKWMLLGGNNLTGEIPSRLGQLTSLAVLNLSHNTLIGTIPASLSNATSLEILLLNHNNLFGEIPLSISALSNLVQIDVSFNNLSGHIPYLQHPSDCDSYKGNKHLHSCPDPYSDSPASLPVPLEVQNLRRHRKLSTLVIVVVTSASVALCILLGLVLLIFFGRSKFGRLSSIRRRQVVTFQDVPIELSYDSVVTATGNFSIRYLIGRGGFGSTYKAELSSGFLVAIKRLSIGRFQGIQQFETEIRTLGRIQHKNLVTLIGYYVGKAEMFLIYNYLSGGNLEAFIHDRSGKNVQWPVIYKIAKDIAEALAFLHYSCVPRIVHRDIKPSNILLDEDLNAYLSDFGLARLLEVSETHATTDVAGTFGYVAPEYATTCRVSDKADVYSFGVVLLELMSGKRSLDPSFSEYGNGFNIVPWAELLMTEGRCSELFSSALWETGPQEKLLGLLKLALTCTVETLSIRPSMKQVLEKLKQLKT